MRRRDYLWAAVVLALLLGWLTDRSLRGVGATGAVRTAADDAILIPAPVTVHPAAPYLINPPSRVLGFVTAENRRDP